VKRLVVRGLVVVLRLLVWARYRITVRGLEAVTGDKGPTLVLCNHPGFTDPLIVFSRVWVPLKPRPLLFAENFSALPLRWIPWAIDALVVPQITSASSAAQAQVEGVIDGVVRGLARGESFVFWPAGQVYRGGRESLRGTRAASEILRKSPGARLVLLRNRGHWGSRFGWAYTGRVPALMRELVRAAWLIAANLLVFMPRRRLTIDLEEIPRAALGSCTRDEVNRVLEAWFNAPGDEAPTFVPGHFLFGARTKEFPPVVEHEPLVLGDVDPKVVRGVASILGELAKGELPPLVAETTLDSLGLDSLDRMELARRIEQRFGFQGADVPLRVGEVWRMAMGGESAGGSAGPVVPAVWARPRPDAPIEVLGNTIPEAFVARVLHDRKAPLVADAMSGVVSAERALVGAELFARRLRALPGEAVGVMLPASVGGGLALLACHLAGKLPVLLNWTTGPAGLDHAVKAMKLGHVVSSRKFLDRAGVKLEGVTVLALEELRAGIGKLEALRCLMGVRLGARAIRRAVAGTDPARPAVVLFTSGSERAPKAVPLTHANILADIRTGSAFLGLKQSDVLLGFLPPFHSFGLTVTTLLPMLGGMRLVHHADPTDAVTLARLTKAYGATMTCSTPTFLRYLVDRAKPGDLDTLRLVAVGAEACPEALFARFAERAPEAELLEGYGITECSPVVAVNPPGAARRGTVGRALPGVLCRVIDADTRAVVPSGERGLLLVAGPTVFPGYLGDAPDPFERADGTTWYVTGDLVAIDSDGYIHFKGRLKRFIKVGGEMISLPALESPFAEAYPPGEQGPRVAVEGIELEGGGRRICLFTTEPLELKAANAMIAAAGFAAIARLDAVERVDAIPVLGTGKTDYKALRARLVEQAAARRSG